MIKLIKPTLISLTTIGFGYYFYQREYDYSLGIYDGVYEKFHKYLPWHAIQFMKVMCYQNLYWKQNIPQQSNQLNDITLNNNLGLAAGFDNDGSMIESLQNLGFGFIEIGSIQAQKNIRLNDDTNSYQQNKNNQIQYQSELQQLGVLKTKASLHSLRKNLTLKVPIGINIMPSDDIFKYTPYLIGNDICNITRELCSVADYLVLNLVSSERSKKVYNEIVTNNIETLTELIDNINKTKLEELGLQAALDHETKKELKGDDLISNFLSAFPLGLKQKSSTPLFVKIKATHQQNILDFLLNQAKINQIQGIVLQKDSEQSEQQYLEQLKTIRQQLPKQYPIISVGEIQNKQIFQERLKNGADSCQILSSFLIKGPSVIKDILL